MENSFIENIEADLVSQMPPVRFSGKVVVVDSAEKAADACLDLLSFPAIGFDTETRPSFRAGTMNRVSLLQLSTPETCYLFRLCKMALEKPIIKVLESRETLKIGADVPNDIKALQQLRHFRPEGFVDLQSIASQWGIAEKSVRKLSAIILGKRVSKAQRLSNWEASTLTGAQCSYAATDAWICLHMYDVLHRTERNPLPAPEPAPEKPRDPEKAKLRNRARNKRRFRQKHSKAGEARGREAVPPGEED